MYSFGNQKINIFFITHPCLRRNSYLPACQSVTADKQVGLHPSDEMGYMDFIF